MEVYEELFDAYKKLGIKDKRIAYLREVKEIEGLLNELLISNNIVPLVKNHDESNIAENMQEKEFLDLNYQRIYKLKILLLQFINGK